MKKKTKTVKVIKMGCGGNQNNGCSVQPYILPYCGGKKAA